MLQNKLSLLLLISATRDEGIRLKLAGDGRASQPGHTAKYGTYSLLDTSRSQICSIKLVQVGGCNTF